MIANDVAGVFKYLTSGQYINERACPDDNEFLCKQWRDRCTVKTKVTPFFLCTREEEHWRPTALHFAIAFNSHDVLVMLIDNGINRTDVAWFGDVVEVIGTGKLIEDPNQSDLSTLSYGAMDLVREMYKKNMHRMTDQLFHRKVVTWKRVCSQYKQKLLYVLQAKKAQARYSAEELNQPGKENLWINLDQDEDEDEDEEGDDFAGFGQVADEEDDDEEGGGGGPEGGDADDIEEVRLDDQSQVSIRTGLSTAFNPAKFASRKPADMTSYIRSQSAKKERKKGALPDVLQKVAKYDWRNHSIVKKQRGDAEMYQKEDAPVSTEETKAEMLQRGGTGRPLPLSLPSSPGPGAMRGQGSNWTESSRRSVLVPVLGKKSYWLESLGHTIEERESQRDGKERAAMIKAAKKEEHKQVGGMCGYTGPPCYCCVYYHCYYLYSLQSLYSLYSLYLNRL